MEGLGINLKLIIQQVVVFLVFVYLFNRFLLDKLLKIVEKREDKITEGLTYAEKMQHEYEDLETKTVAQLENAKKEASKIIEESKKASEQIGNELKEKAKADAEEIIAQSKLQLDKDREELKKTVKQDVAEILESALTKIGLETSEDAKKKSIEQAIENL